MRADGRSGSSGWCSTISGREIDPAGAARIASYVGEAPERFKDIGEVVKYYKENYPPMAKLADSVVAEQVKWSVKPGADGDLVWKMDANVRRPLRGGTAQQRLRFVGAVRANRMPAVDSARRRQRYPGQRDGEPDVHGASSGRKPSRCRA